MSEASVKSVRKLPKIRYRGRLPQISVCLGKLFRSFIYQSDWKVLPMTAVIAGLVSMVIRKDFFLTLEGSLKGAFALTCVAVWNGCFNSIQSVCRERGIVKREHRSGLHISSYVISHMIYQALLCLAQTVLTLYVCNLCGVQFREGILTNGETVLHWRRGLFTPYMIVDIGITLFLTSYASDMISLFVSSITHTTTAAMTVMPFLLIFQLIFSGGLLPLPAWSKPLSNFTVSSYTIRCLAAQSNYNNVPSVSVWNTLDNMMNRGASAEVTFTVGQVADALSNPESESLAALRKRELGGTVTVGQLRALAEGTDAYKQLLEKQVIPETTVRSILDFVSQSPSLESLRSISLARGVPGFETVGELIETVSAKPQFSELLDQKVSDAHTLKEVLDTLKVDAALDQVRDQQFTARFTVGQLLDLLTDNDWVRENRDREFSFDVKISTIVDLIGREKVKDLVSRKTAEAAHKEEYTLSKTNIAVNWFVICCFSSIFAFLSILFLEMIDRDKR